MKTKIGWADEGLNFLTWNCDKVSQGCKNCYAQARSKQYPNNSVGGHFIGAPGWRENAVEELRKTPSGNVVFVNTHSDTFHEKNPLGWIRRMFSFFNARPDLIFLLLTKRPQIALEHANLLKWSANIWLGTSVENNDTLTRIPTLLRVPAQHKFVSLEPLLEGLRVFDLNIMIPRVQWVIAGGESGEMRRPFQKQWAQDIQAVCSEHHIPFFFKQGGSLWPGEDRLLGGRTWDEVPEDFTQLRETNAPPVQRQLF